MDTFLTCVLVLCVFPTLASGPPFQLLLNEISLEPNNQYIELTRQNADNEVNRKIPRQRKTLFAMLIIFYPVGIFGPLLSGSD